VRVALVHDWLTGYRGGEKCLQELALLYPDADLYTLVHVPGSTSPEIEARRIQASPLNRLPGIGRHYRKLLPLFPWAIGRLRLEGYDRIVSLSHAVAKAVPHAPEIPHVSYCFTPMRYVWDQADAYLGSGLKRALSWPLAEGLRRFDRRTSSPQQVTRFVGISETVVERIARRYGREADLVYPPVDVDAIRPGTAPPEDWYLLVGGFVPYKREELAIEAFRGSRRELRVVGDGPTRAALEANAPTNVRFLGRVDDAALHDLYRRCRALVYPQEEDFGIIAVEAQAAGRPVIAFGRGGASETVRPLGSTAEPTGVWFETPDADALAGALERFEAEEAHFDPTAIRRQAERFSRPRFREEIRQIVEKTAVASGV
jgi:glycosyltransferase involved in cell wall biosynthesis